LCEGGRRTRGRCCVREGEGREREERDRLR
jgi:hypothetical protein